MTHEILDRINKKCILPVGHKGPCRVEGSGKKFLHVGCGTATRADVVVNFQEWEEVRCDLDPAANPDIVADLRTLDGVESEAYDGLYCSHALEHVHSFDWAPALSAFRRVLRTGGLMFLVVPNLKGACRFIAEGHAGTFYDSPAGPIFAHEVLFGKESWTAKNLFMRHLSGFTPDLLRGVVLGAGFRPQYFSVDEFNLAIGAVKMSPEL